MNIAIGSDHGGFELKETIKSELKKQGHQVLDVGTFSTESVDYPDFCVKAAGAVLEGRAEFGIMVDGAGVGSAMAANKMRGIRAAVCNDHFSARNAREHNNANMLCMGSMIVGKGAALEIVKIFLESLFEGGRHQRRVDKIMAVEGEKIMNHSSKEQTVLKNVISAVVDQVLAAVNKSSEIKNPDAFSKNVPASSGSFKVKTLPDFQGKVLTEDDLKKIVKNNKKEITIPHDTIITPLANDFAGANSIAVKRKTFPAKNARK